MITDMIDKIENLVDKGIFHELLFSFNYIRHFQLILNESLMESRNVSKYLKKKTIPYFSVINSLISLFCCLVSLIYPDLADWIAIRMNMFKYIFNVAGKKSIYVDIFILTNEINIDLHYQLYQDHPV